MVNSEVKMIYELSKPVRQILRKKRLLNKEHF